MRFESELEKGRLLVGECSKCKKIVWPPSEFCSKCFGILDWRASKEIGKIIEFSSKDGKFFCVVEFEKPIRVIGHLSAKKNPHVGQKVKLEGCGIQNGKYNFEVSLIEE